MAQESGFETGAHFPNVIRGHLRLLELLQYPLSLSTLHYLCSIPNAATFVENIQAMDCPEGEKNGLIYDLGLGQGGSRADFDTFRNLIRKLGRQAEESGWNNNGNVGSMSITKALNEGASLLLPVDSSGDADVLLRYLCRELRANNKRQFFLLIDSVSLAGTGIEELLKASDVRFRYGLLDANVIKMVGGAEALTEISAQMQRLITFAMPVAPIAESLVSLIGKTYVQRTTTNEGTDREWMGIFPDRRSQGVAVHWEQANRVEAETVQSLRRDQVLLVDFLNNQFGII